MLSGFIESAWEIDCSRCSNSATSYEVGRDAAAEGFASNGWCVEGSRVYCPGCAA